jgi:hypothetical protein
MVYRAPNDQDEGDVHTGTRVCRTCDERKSMAEFHWAASKKHRTRVCKPCVHARQAVLIAKRKEQGDPLFRADRLRREYGLTPGAVAAMRETQGGACAICEKPFRDEPVGERMHIDHCHETGHVRALLCHNCNLGLGHFRDNEELMLKAVAYLTQHRARTSGLPAPGGRGLTPAERKERRSAAALRQHRSAEGQKALLNRSTTIRGEQNPTSRLREEEVLAIRTEYARGGISQRELAAKFGVTQTNVGLIVRRKIWAHV